MGKSVGEGAFSTVRKGVHRETREVVAVKVMDKSKFSPEDTEALYHEVKILRTVRAPRGRPPRAPCR